MKHKVFDHIAKQIIKFAVAYNNEVTKKMLRENFIDLIRKNKSEYLEKFKKYNPDINELNLYLEIENIIYNDPDLYIFIDYLNDDLRDLCTILKNSMEIKVIEVLKLKQGKNITYTFNNNEYAFTRDESEPIKESDASQKYWKIFDELINRFKKSRPQSTYRGSTRDDWLKIPMGTSGFHLEWHFTGREPKKKLEVGIHFEHKNQFINHQVFEYFNKKKLEIESLFKKEVIFQKYWLKNGEWSRIYLSEDIEDLDNFNKQENLREWALETMIQLYDFYFSLKSEIKELANQNLEMEE